MPNSSRPLAVVTGSSRGIGRAIALKLAHDGFDLYCCSRNEESLAKLMEDIKAEVPECKLETRSCDVSEADEVKAMAASLQESARPVRVLVNNAGVFRPGNIADEEEGCLELMLNTNLYSAYHLSRGLLSLLKPGSDIINICSVASLKPYPGGGSYGISKYAMLGFSQNLREELKDAGIRVTAVMPGATLTDSWAGVELPEERFMPAEDVAEAVCNAIRLSPRTVVEDIVLRPQLGDI